jgi:hypothetical protein
MTNSEYLEADPVVEIDTRLCRVCDHPIGHHGHFSCAGDDQQNCDCAKRYALAAIGELRPPYPVVP